MSIRSYIEVTKPKTVLLLAFTCVAAMLVASRSHSLDVPLHLWVPALAAITAGSAGCNAVTCYVDRDIDRVMRRTQGRPLPSGRISPPEKALYWGAFLLVVALALALARSFLSFVSLLAGIADNVFIYSLFLKRRNPVNIILGGFSGGLPPFFGWVYVTNSIDITAILVAALVVLWIPYHIWNLALYHRSDYEKAGIPMLPVVISTEKAIRCIVSTAILLLAFSIALYFVEAFGWIYLTIALASGLVAVTGNIYLLFNPTPEHAWKMFKISSPHLFILFLAMIVDVLVT